MSKYIRQVAMPLALSLLALAGGCKSRGDAAGDSALTSDSALNRDLALANRDTAAQPQLSDVPASTGSTAPARRTPSSSGSRPSGSTARTPAPNTTKSGNTVERGAGGNEGRIARIGAGTTIALTSNERVCTNNKKAGDRFVATVAEQVTGENGATIPAGATAVVQVTSVDRSNNAGDPIRMGFVVQQISWGGKSYPVDASIESVKIDQVRSESRKSDATKVVGGAVVGAVVGQILGKDTKSTVIGAATGAAAGTAVAMATGNYEGCLPEGGRIVIKLNSPATVQAE